jgi:N-acetylglucosamine-6-sulfatase
LGYRTGLFGKYMNEWGRQEEPTAPPGWDVFRAMVTANGGAATYYNYDIVGTEPVESHSSLPADYSTDVFAQDTADFIASVPAEEPFFAMYTPFAPHGPSTSAPRHLGLWPTESLVPPANERDMSDKPEFMQTIPLQSRQQITTALRKQHESLLAVDDAVQQIVDAVGPDRVANTLFVFTSDNGLLNGDHRLQRKNSPYEGATEIPLVLRWDGVIDSGETTTRLFTLQDITATIVEATGATLSTEGVSWISSRRSGSVIEGTAQNHSGVERPAYCGWRTSRYLYVRYSDGAGEELYDYAVDPAELRNAIAKPDYAGVADTMRANAQAACQPGPPGFLWEPEEPPPGP